MSLLAARKLVESAFTLSALNAQVDALNAIYTLTVPHLASVKSSVEIEPSNLQPADFPTFLTHVATIAGAGEIRSQGKRDDHISAELTFLGREAALTDAEQDADVLAEATRAIIETLDSAQYGATRRYCVQVTDLTVDVARYAVAGAVVRIGCHAKFTMLMRTEGL